MTTNSVNFKQSIQKKYQYSSIFLGVSFCAFFWYANTWLNLIGPLFFLLIVCLSLFLTRTKKYETASLVLVLAIWAAPSWCILVSGGLYSPLIIWLLPPTLMSGILLGWRWSIFIGLLSVILILLLSYFAFYFKSLNEFYSTQINELLFILSTSSAIILITYYGFNFAVILENRINELTAKKSELVKQSVELQTLVDELSNEKIAKEKLHEEMRFMATHDSLTGLLDRTVFIEFLDKMLHEAKRKNGVVAVMFLDLDSFKQVNDTFGHTVGDQVLKQVATVLNKTFRGNDVISRMGGDEFVVALSGIYSEENLSVIAERLIEKIKAIKVKGISLNSTFGVSIGITYSKSYQLSAESYINQSDKLMYKAKTSEGKRFSIAVIKDPNDFGTFQPSS